MMHLPRSSRLWALNLVAVACAVLTCSAQRRTTVFPLTGADHVPALLTTPARTSAVERHAVWHLSPSQIGTTALQAMPFLATLTFALVVCTVANMMSTVQGHTAQLLHLDAKMVILISCAGGLVSTAGLFVFTRPIHRKMEVALHMDSLPDNWKAWGKVRQLCRGWLELSPAGRLAICCGPALQQQVWCCHCAAGQVPATG